MPTTPTPARMALADMKRTARSHLADARVLRRGGRYDGAVYLCGYAVEIALKARICRTLQWAEYPAVQVDGGSFKTHAFRQLLWLTGIQDRVQTAHGLPNPDWSVVQSWDPAMRYGTARPETAASAAAMIASATAIVRILIP